MASTNQSAPSNPLDDDKTQPKENIKSMEQDSTNESLTKLISDNIQPMREDQVQNAVKFLSHPKVRGSPVIYRRSFLEKKGLTKEEIDEAFRRVPDPSPTTVEATTMQAVQHNPQASVQSQAPIVAATSAAAPVSPVPTPSTIQKYKFQWSHALLAIGILTASGAGTAVVFKNVVLPRLKEWICKVVKDKNDAEEKENSKPDPSEEVAEVAKQAASAAAIVAKTTQELLLAKSEDRKYFEALKTLLDVQVEELKSMGNAIRNLESTKEVHSVHEQHMQGYNQHAPANGNTRNSQRIYYGERSETSYPLPATMPPERVNGFSDKDDVVGRASAPASVVEPTGAPYSKSYMDIMAMIQRGETPPGIKEINDMPPNPNQQLSNPRVAPRLKPWELVQQDPHSPSYVNGKPSESSENIWDRKSVKITEVAPDKEDRGPLSYGIGSSEWRGRGWVPPQPPSVSIPEAAAAIRQPKSSAQKQQAGKITPVVDDGVDRPLSSGDEAAGSSVTEIATPSTSEIQEEPIDAVNV